MSHHTYKKYEWKKHNASLYVYFVVVVVVAIYNQLIIMVKWFNCKKNVLDSQMDSLEWSIWFKAAIFFWFEFKENLFVYFF